MQEKVKTKKFKFPTKKQMALDILVMVFLIFCLYVAFRTMWVIIKLIAGTWVF